MNSLSPSGILNILPGSENFVKEVQAMHIPFLEDQRRRVAKIEGDREMEPLGGPQKVIQDPHLDKRCMSPRPTPTPPPPRGYFQPNIVDHYEKLVERLEKEIERLTAELEKERALNGR